MAIEYFNDDIKDIWDEETRYHIAKRFWLVLLDFMQEAGWNDAKRVVDNWKIDDSSEHEVIKMYHRFVKETGLVNAHTGLTSSDIIDNVRLVQIRNSIHVVVGLLCVLESVLSGLISNKSVKCVGYTHWQIASPTTMNGRLSFFIERVSVLINEAPIIRQKRLGGAIGDGAALVALLGVRGYNKVLSRFSDWFFSFYGCTPSLTTTIQSSDHLNELDVIHWLSKVAGLLHQLAYDIRFLCHTGEIKTKRNKDYCGSSCMPHKNNPFEFERVCGLTRLVMRNYVSSWEVLANNGMERTLDGSSTLKTILPESFNLVSYSVGLLNRCLGNIEFNEDKIKELLLNHPEINNETDTIKLIKKGLTRWEAYNQLK